MGLFIPAVIASLAGWYADNKWNDSKVTDWVAGEATETAKKTTTAFAENAGEAGKDLINEAVEGAGLNQDSGLGKFFNANLGKMALGLPLLYGAFKIPFKPLRNLALAAIVITGAVMMAKDYMADTVKNDFEVAANEEPPRNTVSYVPHGHPDFVKQGPDGSYDFSFSKNDGPDNELG